jgi:hypothetical protein
MRELLPRNLFRELQKPTIGNTAVRRVRGFFARAYAHKSRLFDEHRLRSASPRKAPYSGHRWTAQKCQKPIFTSYRPSYRPI